MYEKSKFSLVFYAYNLFSSFPPSFSFVDSSILPTAVVIFCISFFLKFLLFPSYYSTDFEVHRNWLAITYSLPFELWYKESTSIWTIDYPPFFAYFEFALSHVASFFDPKMLRVENLNYASYETIFFQRLSVLFTEVFLAYGVYRLFFSICKVTFKLQKKEKNNFVFISLIITLLNAGLLIVDNIHFQYNGFLLGILLLSISNIQNGNICIGAALFCSLLYLKHIFVYVVPVYFVYLLKQYCMQHQDIHDYYQRHNHNTHDNTNLYYFHYDKHNENNNNYNNNNNNHNNHNNNNQYSSKIKNNNANEYKNDKNIKTFSTKIFIRRFLNLSFVIFSVSFVALGPIYFSGQFRSLMKRLFPFENRGLLHAYWAPNLWAIYAAADRLFFKIGVKTFGDNFILWCGASPEASPTLGLVQNVEMSVLPSISPFVAFFLTFLLYLVNKKHSYTY